MHEMRTTATDVTVASATRLRPAKTASRVEVLFGVKTPTGPKEYCRQTGPDFPTDSMQPSTNYFGYRSIKKFSKVDKCI